MVQPEPDIVLSNFAEAIGHTILVVGAFYLAYVFMSYRVASAGATLPSRTVVRRLAQSYAIVIAAVAVVAWYNQNNYIAARHPGYWIEDNCTRDESGIECDQRQMTPDEQEEAATAAL